MMDHFDLVERRQCPLCSSRGHLVYEGLKDKIFGCPGTWTLMGCEDTACSLVWLTPMFARKDLHIAYSNYYTHGDPGVQEPSWDGQALWLFQRLDRLSEKLLGLRSERMRFGAAYLDDMTPGRLLDVGCGSGAYLKTMRELGWIVEGTDFDPLVSAAMSESGIKVHIGELADIDYPSETFDAITLRHVIEHVEEPVSMLIECWRLLKPHGRLVLITPNIESYGHQIYKHNWRGLEPPRHLHLFSVDALRRVAINANIASYKLFSTAQGASYIFLGSEMLLSSWHKSWLRLARVLFWFWVWQYAEIKQIRKHGREVGEELVFVAEKS